MDISKLTSPKDSNIYLEGYGNLLLHYSNKSALRNLGSIVKEKNLSNSELISHLIQELISNEDKSSLSINEIESLNKQDRLSVMKLIIDMHPAWFSKTTENEHSAPPTGEISLTEYADDETRLANALELQISKMEEFPNSTLYNNGLIPQIGSLASLT